MSLSGFMFWLTHHSSKASPCSAKSWLTVTRYHRYRCPLFLFWADKQLRPIIIIQRVCWWGMRWFQKDTADRSLVFLRSLDKTIQSILSPSQRLDDLASPCSASISNPLELLESSSPFRMRSHHSTKDGAELERMWRIMTENSNTKMI